MVNLTSANTVVAVVALAIVSAAGATAVRDGLGLDPSATDTAPTASDCSLGAYVGSFDDAYDIALGVVSSRALAVCD